MKHVFRKVATNSLAISIGIVYLWFGVLKFFPHLSPAEDLAKNTIYILDFGLIPSNTSIVLLALWETGVGLLLIFNLFKRWALGLAIVHIVLTFTPMFFFPEQIFTNGSFGLTLLGQYIIKNIIIFSLLVSLYIGNKKEIRFLQTTGSHRDNYPRKRAVQYSWQAQRVDSSLETPTVQDPKAVVEPQY